MADSNNKQVSVAQAAYSAATAADFTAWLDANPAKAKDGTESRRVASLSANVPDDELFSAMHWPALRDIASEYRDGDLSFVTRYAVRLADAIETGSIKVPKEARQQVIDALVADRKTAEEAKADRLRGVAGANQEAYKQSKAKADMLDKLIAQGLIDPAALAGLS